MPFASLRLTGRRPREFPRGFPHQPVTLGQRILQRRMDLGLTQQTLADRLGCWAQTVASGETNRSPWPAAGPQSKLFWDEVSSPSGSAYLAASGPPGCGWD